MKPMSGLKEISNNYYISVPINKTSGIRDNETD